MSSEARVSIPNKVRKTIQNIKEITGNHSEDEIYAMLKECSMDPNETAQKLLLQDTFHEVRRKRDRKKENPNKESTEPRWKPGMQGRGSRGGWGSYPSRHISHDAGGGRTALSAKENVINQGSILPIPQDKKNKETSVVASSPNVVIDGPSAATAGSKLEGPLPHVPPIEAEKSVAVGLGTGSTHGQLMSNSHNISASKSPSPSSGINLSASDPILMPSQDSRLPVGTISREIGTQQAPIEQFHEALVDLKLTASGSEVESSFKQGKTPSDFQGDGKNLLLESSPLPPAHVSSTTGRPSSNYDNRSQQAIGPAKGGLSKEWKPKAANHVLGQGRGTGDSTEGPVEADAPSQPASSVLGSKDVTSEKERKLDDPHMSDGQHVIIPNHLHVPEADKLGFCFGSFDSFITSSLNGPVRAKSPSLSEASGGVAESVEEHSSRNQDALISADEGDYHNHTPSTCNAPENLSPEHEVSSSVAPEYSESKQETSLPTAGNQYPVVHASPNFTFGFMPPVIGSQLAPSESSESQVRDGSRVPNYVIQHPFDQASYYAQFYRSGTDSDGRISPFHSPGVATKNNGNVAILPPQASQSSQEVGNSLKLSGAGPTPIATQAAGVMQSSIAVTQQPLPVFRHPTGVHLPGYPPNYIPYGPYFPPFYIPSPAIHQFLSNGTFPQQPQAGSIYPAPPVATTKYPLPQYKSGSNTGNSGHIGMPGNYGAYGSSPAGYNPSSAAAAGNSSSNEDLGGSQFKESNVYITGQQSEGSGVWIPTPGRDISGSFYNLPQGGQVAYNPGHGTFAGIYHHPAQPVTTGALHPFLQQSQTIAGGVDMVGPTASMYQPTQVNWPNNY